MSVLEKLQAAVGADIVLAPNSMDLARHLGDFNVRAEAGLPLLGLALPRTAHDVSAILRICHAHGVSVTPQGGMTGMAGGAVPGQNQLVVSLERMRAIEEIDPDSGTMTVQAGVALQTVQEAAAQAGFFFPLDLGGRGSCQMGGAAATNAGGNRVLRYGMMRDLVLGVEAVLADGTIISSLNKMLKNNAGYDLKQLFIGSEGTLGIITRLVVKMAPKPVTTCTGLAAAENYGGVLRLLRLAREGFGGALSAFEVMWPDFYDIGTKGLGRTPPIANQHGLFVLMETLGADPGSDSERFEEVIARALESGVIRDAVIAGSVKQTNDLWAIRDCPGEFQKVFWPQVSFDVSVPTAQIENLKQQIEAALTQRWPHIEMLFFGHVADANLHFSVKLGDGMTEREIDDIAYAVVGRMHGSISAEHGIGSAKRSYLHHSRTPAEIALMRTLKAALDPKGVLNPGKVI